MTNSPNSPVVNIMSGNVLQFRPRRQTRAEIRAQLWQHILWSLANNPAITADAFDRVCRLTDVGIDALPQEGDLPPDGAA